MTKQENQSTPTADEPEYIVRLTENEMQNLVNICAGYTNMATQLKIRVHEATQVKFMRTVHKFKTAMTKGVVV
jgi:hypothetical protein